jgi:hypothetical protein
MQPYILPIISQFSPYFFRSDTEIPRSHCIEYTKLRRTKKSKYKNE